MRFIGFIIILIISISCSSKEDNTPDENAYPKPKHFPPTVYNFNNNPLKPSVFELGKMLFYEEKLSRDQTQSCGGCHIASAAFTHHGHEISHGIDNLLGNRNAPPVFNLAWQTHFFWDGRVENLDHFSQFPIENPVEMDESMASVRIKLQEDPLYQSAFTEAYGSTEVTNEKIFKALSQFMLAIISDRSKYDAVQRGEMQFTAQELRGKVLFDEKCSACHTPPLFYSNTFRNIGLPLNNSLQDLGRFSISGDSKDKNAFKVPTLRNLAFTSPYMHDGRFSSLRAVLQHYRTGVEDQENLDPLLKNENTLGIPLTNEEVTDLLAFLQTLNDELLIQDERFIE